MKRAVLALADGALFEGRSFGAPADSIGEVVFNTSMFGYQEILTDPSYVGQIVTMAYPEMGNVGANPDDQESPRPHSVGMVVRSVTGEASNWRSREELDTYLKRNGIAGIEGVDTRKLVRHLRNQGSQMGIISSESSRPSALVAKAAAAHGMEGLDLATGVSTKSEYVWATPPPNVLGGASEKAALIYEVIAYDYGLKRSMLQFLVGVGCRVTVVPSTFPASEVLARRPHGVFLANGPGDPAAVKGAEKTVAALLGKIPIFGICLGHQILALALGGKTYKMKFGHRGANQPVLNQLTNKVEITTQNHGFAVRVEDLPRDLEPTHINLNDQTLEGMRHRRLPVFSVQYHPEASAGPHDSGYLFEEFRKLMG